MSQHHYINASVRWVDSRLENRDEKMWKCRYPTLVQVQGLIAFIGAKSSKSHCSWSEKKNEKLAFCIYAFISFHHSFHHRSSWWKIPGACLTPGEEVVGEEKWPMAEQWTGSHGPLTNWWFTIAMAQYQNGGEFHGNRSANVYRRLLNKPKASKI